MDPVVVTSVALPSDVPFAANPPAVLGEIVVERTLYGNVDGVARSAASSVIGQKVR